MTRREKTWLIGIVALIVYAYAVSVTGSALELKGSDLWVLRGVLWLCGIAVAAVLLWYFLRQLKPAPATMPVRDDIETLIATAKARLVSGRFPQKAALNTSPVVLWLGAERSGKTTAVTRSGLEPELVAGEVFQGDAVAATRAINLWYCSNAIFLETGGTVVAEPTRWNRLIRHLQPRRLAAVLARGAQASRVAVVCVSCEDLLKPAGADDVRAMTDLLRARLAELSQRLGIRLPVYVFFTKLDLVPHFADYVAQFSAEEARDLLGATLPLVAVPASTYSERVFERVNQSLERIFFSLAAKRLQFLPRESRLQARAAAYEFPREFRKIGTRTAQLLVDLCRPSQQALNPFLRGFYFTGLRAVMVSEAGAAARRSPSVAQSAGATQLFRPEAEAVAQSSPAAGSQKVPEWTFLGAPIRDVILRDRVAMGLTAGGTHVNLLRRALLASAAGLALIFTLGLMVSFAGNRRLERGVLTSAAGLAGTTLNNPDLPPLETVRRLDSLRRRVEAIADYRHNGAPLRYRWGLNTTAALYPEARRIYFTEFGRLIFGPTNATMVTTLRALPNSPREGAEYQAVYDLLKAHLIVTAYPDRSTPEFLAPVLLHYWLDNRNVEEGRRQLAQAQFTLFSNELRSGNPFQMKTDSGAVGHARNFLQQFTGSERIYQFMLSEAAKQQPGIQFNRNYPGSANVLTNTYEVPAAFTRAGWAFMQGAFTNIDRYFQGEAWVLGDQGPRQQERGRVTEELRSRYRDDYLRHWRTFLASARFTGYAGVRDAAQKLAVISGNQSPLLQMFSLASQNTAVDSVVAATVFQPLQLITPAAAKDKLIGESNQGYMGGLVALQSSVEQLTGAGGDAAAGKVVTDAGTAKVAARQIAQKFSSDPGSVGGEVQRLMLAPIAGVEQLVGGLGASGLNRRGRDFCRPFETLLARAPFRPGAGADAPLADVSSQFQRGTGALWSFYNDVLQQYLSQQGTRYGPKPGSALSLSPGFIEFFNRAAAFSDALYPQDGPGPRLTFTFRPLLSELMTSVVLSIDGRTATFTRTMTGAQPFVWIGTEARDARVTVQVGGNEVTFSQQGPWAVFRLFQMAQGWRVNGIVQRAHWTTRHQGTDVAIPFELNLGGAPAVFDPAYFTTGNCSGDIAR